MSVREAALKLGLSERTIWRQIRAGALRTRRDGRRVHVLLDDARLLASAGSARIGEPAAPYGDAPDESPRGWQVGPWPYTPEIAERHRRAQLVRRRAAIATIKELAKLTKPDPDGLTFVDYLQADADHPRALEGGAAADRALDELARERRRHR